jgi:hypothetical protein
MDIDTSNASPIITYNNITVKKITISSFSIDPLKRIANFTVSYWNGTVFLGQESYTYKATYIQPITQPVLKSLSVPSMTSYAIKINAKIGGTTYTIPPFTSLYPYLTSGLTIYYSQIDPSIISLVPATTSYNSMTIDTRAIPNKYTYTDTGSFGTFVSLTNYASSSNNTGPGTIPYLSIANASYSFVDTNTNNIRVFYTVGDVQYSVITGQPTPSLLCRAGITTLYKNSDNVLSVTTDPFNFNIPLQIGTTDTLNVQSEPNTTVSNSAIQTNIYIYNGYEATPIYKSVSVLPSLSIYYNPNNISDISVTASSTYTLTASSVSFTSVIFIQESLYQFTNLSYIVNNVTVTFQSKQLQIASSAIDSSIICQNPLNTSDIGFQDDKTNYDNIISIMSSTPTPTTTQFYNLIKTFNTTKNITSTSVSMNSAKGTFSI